MKAKILARINGKKVVDWKAKSHPDNIIFTNNKFYQYTEIDNEDDACLIMCNWNPVKYFKLEEVTFSPNTPKHYKYEEQ